MTNPTQPARARTLLLAFAATAVAMLGFSVAAQAAPSEVASGNTDLHLKKGMQRKLANNGIDLLGLGATPVAGSKIGLVVSQGTLDPTDARALAAAPAPLARRAVRRWLRCVLDGGEAHPPDAAAVDRVLAVARCEIDATEVAGGVRIARSGGRLSVHR